MSILYTLETNSAKYLTPDTDTFFEGVGLGRAAGVAQIFRT